MMYKEAQEQFELWTRQVERKQKEIDDTIKRYGTGVRPSFVSADLAMARQGLDNAKKQVEYYEYVMLHLDAAYDAQTQEV